MCDSDDNGEKITENILGVLDANDAWKQDQERSAESFVQIKAFENFKKPHYSCLFGLRGTGKSAILRKMKHDIDVGKLKSYNYCTLICDNNLFTDMSCSFKGSLFERCFDDKNLTTIFLKMWQWIVRITAMQQIIAKSKDTSNEFLSIKKYISNYQEIPSLCINRVVTEVYKRSQSTDESYWITANFLLEQKLYTDEYNKVTVALRNFLRNRREKVLIIFDSVEEYAIKDKVPHAIVSALVQMALNIQSDDPNLIVKVAIPAELQKYLAIQNPVKHNSKMVYITWTYSDLVRVLAKRFDIYYNGNNRGNFDNEEISSVVDYLYSYMDSKIKTRQNLSFDTIAHVIRHTQKKPRDILLIFNTILTLHKNKGEKISEKTIYLGIHQCLNDLIESCLQLYDEIFPETKECIKKALYNKPGIFNYTQVDEFLGKISKLRGENYARDELADILIQAGVIGEYTESRDTMKSADGSEVMIMYCKYAYQIKGIAVSKDANVQLAVHPMYYEYLGTQYELNKYIYPIPSEGTEKELLEKAGVYVP